jgi:hypothetical protein
MSIQELRDRTARQFREARKTPEGRYLARIVWRALKEQRRRFKESRSHILDWAYGA